MATEVRKQEKKERVKRQSAECSEVEERLSEAKRRERKSGKDSRCPCFAAQGTIYEYAYDTAHCMCFHALA